LIQLDALQRSLHRLPAEATWQINEQLHSLQENASLFFATLYIAFNSIQILFQKMPQYYTVKFLKLQTAFLKPWAN